MSTTVTIAWLPVKKDAESSTAVASLKGLKDAKLATPGLEHAFHGKGTDPNEPPAVEIIDSESSESSLLPVTNCFKSLVFRGRSQGSCLKLSRR